MGSKSRIAKYILPIILKDRKDGQYYVEPFCGGCNTIDKVDGNRIAADKNPYLIRMWQCLIDGWNPPTTITRDYYNDVRRCYKCNSDEYPPHLIGWVGFMGSYNGKFFDGGYSGHSVYSHGAYYDYIEHNIRNILRQVPYLKEVSFLNSDYKDIVLPPSSIIYCDPPYKVGTKYSYSINNDEFFEWCRRKSDEGHKVFISEYSAPDNFICVWEKRISVGVAPVNKNFATEKLFTLK